jgi:hygromycin-B 7''-O-kinase
MKIGLQPSALILPPSSLIPPIRGFAMAQPRPLLPILPDRAAYESIQTDVQTWLPAMRVICQRHGVPFGALARLSEGTNIIFAAGTQHIIKLYPPHWRRLCAVERLVAEHLHAKLSVTTPEIVAANELEGWPYLVMQRLAGRYLAEVWNHLPLATQQRLATDLGALLAQLHALPTHGLDALDADWPVLVDDRIHDCVARHREQGMPEAWLEQLPAYLAHAQPLYPPSFAPAIVSGDIHQYHLLVDDRQGQWRLTGLFDFDDARIGFHEYDLAATGLFLMYGRPQLLRAFLQTYGYGHADLTDALSHRLLAYTLLHRYRRFTWVRDEVVGDRTCTTFAQLATTIYALG